MNVLDVLQGSPEWLAVRVGKATASRAKDWMARTKHGPGAARIDYLYELLAERLTGRATERYLTNAMRWGLEYEDEARRTAAFELDLEIETTGFVLHPRIANMGASPDGFVTDPATGEVGLIQIKCPTSRTHVASLISGDIDVDYLWQMQCEMACTELNWCLFVSYDPRMPDELALFQRRVNRDEEMINALEAEAEAFLSDLEDLVRDLKRRAEEIA